MPVSPVAAMALRLCLLLATAYAHGGQTEGPRYKPEMMDFEGYVKEICA